MDDRTKPGGQPGLPSGQVIALDTLVRQRAERERIDAALAKLRSQCGLADTALQAIEQQFTETLYLQALIPEQWHSRALAIVQTVLGKASATVEKTLNQILFVSSRFHFAEPVAPRHLARYATGEPIPAMLLESAPSPADHTMHDIDGYLANRLGQTVLETLRQEASTIEFFIGPKSDMVEYYRTRDPALALRGELQSPTSTEFYLFADAVGHSTVVITGISNPSRFHHQLWQLKYAGIALERLQVRGHFDAAIAPQVAALQRELTNLPVKPRVAIIGQRWWPMEMLGRLAGITGTEGTAYQALRPTAFQVGPFVFDYLIADAAGAPSWRSKVGIVAFRMPNGSLAGDAVRALRDAGMTHLLLAGAGGALGEGAAVGTYQLFDRAAHNGQDFVLPEASVLVPELPDELPMVRQGTNVTVDSPLEETRAWLDDARREGCHVVDVESAHIFRALLQHPDPETLYVTPGLFISDVVGSDASLVEKISIDDAYAHLQPLLACWFAGIGIAGVHDADGALWHFVESAQRPDNTLSQYAQAVPDLARGKLLGVRMQTDDFRVVSHQRRKVGYPDLKAMTGHRPILYVIPPAQADMNTYEAMLGALDPESLFLCFPTDAPQAVIDRAREVRFEAIVIVEPDQVNLPTADFLVARDTGWGTYATVVANRVQAVAVFGDPSCYASLLVKFDNEDRPVLVEESMLDTPAIKDLVGVEPFTAASCATVLGKALKLDRLARWVARVRPDIRVMKLSQLRGYADGRMIIGVSGSSKASQFDAAATEDALVALLQGLDPGQVLFATGGTDYGVEKILHRLIRTDFQRFACVGLITNEGRGDDLGTPAVAIAGNDWFGRSVPFLNTIDVLITVAGGSVVRQELLMAHKAGIPVLPLAGSGMSSDDFLTEHPALPRHASGADLVRAIEQLSPRSRRRDREQTTAHVQPSRLPEPSI